MSTGPKMPFFTVFGGEFSDKILTENFSAENTPSHLDLGFFACFARRVQLPASCPPPGPPSPLGWSPASTFFPVGLFFGPRDPPPPGIPLKAPDPLGMRFAPFVPFPPPFQVATHPPAGSPGPTPTLFRGEFPLQTVSYRSVCSS